MKRLLLALCVLLAAVSAASAQETTWIDPLSPSPVPGSMLSSVTAGALYDEIDIIFLSPAELSNYKGFSFFTAYGNYEYNWVTGTGILNSGVTTPINPLINTVNPTQGTNIGNFLFGIGMPIATWRLGALAGFRFGQSDNFNTGTVTGFYNSAATVVVDGDNDNAADFTYANTRNYYDTTGTLRFAAESGLDLGFMGLSLLAYVDSTGRTLGGTYTYVRTQGTDPTSTLPNDAVMAKTVTFGTGTGNAAGYPTVSGTNFQVAANAELMLSLLGISFPLTAGLEVSGKPYDAVTAYAYNPAVTTNVTATNMAGVLSPTANTSITYTTGATAMATGWNPAGTAWLITGNQTLNQAAFRALLDAAILEALALDTVNLQNSKTSFGLTGRADPILSLGSGVRLKTRGELGYTMSFGGYSSPGTSTIAYSEANAASATNSAYSRTQTFSDPLSSFENEIDVELGGIVEFKESTGFFTLSAGLVCNPVFDFESTTRSGQVTTTTVRWTDQTNTDVDATGLTAIGPGTGGQGSRTDTSRTAYGNNGAGGRTYLSGTFSLPVSTKLTLIKDTLSLIGGYTLEFQVDSTTTTTPTLSTVTATTTSVSNIAGTVVYTSPANANSDSSGGATTVTNNSSVWNGVMSFMVRWTPAANVTVDFFGNSFMNALNFELFGSGGTGFNPQSFISKIGVSVSLRM